MEPGASQRLVQVLGLGEGPGSLQAAVAAGTTVDLPVAGTLVHHRPGLEVVLDDVAAGLEVDPERAVGERVPGP